MAYTVQQLLSDLPLLVNFLTEPTGWEESDATHWITIVPVTDANQNSFDIPSLNSDRINEIVSFFSQEGVRFDLSESGELYSTNKCVKFTAQLPYLDEELESTEYDLGHKVLVRVESERVGIGGNYHFVTIVDPNPDINGLTGYIKFENAIKLPDTPHSLPIALDTCLDQLGKPDDICSFASTIWHKTREPYYDQDSCHYSVSVATEFADTGNEQLRDRMLAQIEPGVRRLLEYYNKQRTSSTIDRLMAAFKFAEAPSWYIDPKRSSSRLKVLVTVHAKYFDAVPEQDDDVDMGSISFRTSRTIFLLSSEVRSHISSIIATMYGYDGDYNWLRAQAGWAGPGDEFGHFSFKEQAEDLELFIPNFERFFILNNFALRGDYPDAIEIGLTDQGQMTYVSVTAPEIGSKMFKVGLESLSNMGPFNNPRTLGYVERSREFFQEYERNGGVVSGGWQRFIKYYTNPSPEYSIENREKCRPTLTNPFKCIPNNFRNYLDNHKQDPKCSGIPPDKQIGNVDNRYGKKLWKDIKTGVSNLDPDGGNSPYSRPSKPVKWGDFLEVERKDLAGFTKYLNDADSDLGYDFVGDGEFERAFSNIKKRQSTKNINLIKTPFGSSVTTLENPEFGKSLSNAAIDSLNDLFENVISKFPLEDITNELLQCTCRQIRCKVEDLEELGEFDKARAYSLQAAALGCDNVCGVIPILCSCIPIEFPPKLTLPIWPLPTVDIMAFIPSLIINGIVSAFLSFVVDFMTGMLDDLREKCKREGFCAADGPKDEFLKFFNNSYPFDSDEYFQAQEVQENFSAFPVITSSVLSSLLRDTSTILSPREFCQVINGEADIDTLMLLEALVEESYPEVRGVFTNTEKIRNLFVSLGRLIDPAICTNLVNFMDSAGVNPVNHMCDNTEFRDNVLNGRANREQIRDFLDDALKCDTDRLDNLIKAVEAISRGEDALESILPPIFQTPSQPNGLIPRDPPSVKYLGDLVTNSIFESVENVFHGEVDQHIPTLVTTNDELQSGNSDQEQQNTLVGFFNSLSPGEVSEAQMLGLNLPFGFSPSLDGATLADSIKDRLSGLRAPIISEPSDRFIVLQLPSRKIRSNQIDDTNAPLAASSGLSILKPINSNDFYTEQAKITYNLCPAPPSGTSWGVLRDAYSINVKTKIPTQDIGYSTDFNFVSAKAIDLVSKFAISRNFDGTTGRLLGLRSPFEEAFANFVSKKWSELSISEETNNKLFDPDEVFYKFNLNLVGILNKSFIENIASNISRSKFLKPDTLNEQMAELRRISFRPDPSCGRTSRVPGLLNIGDINQRHKDAYEGSEKDNPARYVDATTYALALIYIRVCLSQMLLDGVFPFSYFKVKDILTSDLIVRYFLNRFKEQIKDNQFYKLMAASIREVIEEDLSRNGNLMDPITGRPVEIIFGDVDSVSFSQVESSTSCVSAAAIDENCVLIGPTELSSEITDGAIGSNGMKTIGYMEYVIKDQLRVMSDEFEALMQTQMVDLNFHIFKDYISTADVAIFAEDGLSFSRLTSAASDQEFVQDLMTNSRVQEYGLLVRNLRQLFDGNITKEQLGYPFNGAAMEGELATQFVSAFHNLWTDMNLSSNAIQELRASTIDVIITDDNVGTWSGPISIPLSGEIVSKPEQAAAQVGGYTSRAWRTSHSFLWDQRRAIKNGVFNNVGSDTTVLSRLALLAFFDKSLDPGFSPRLTGVTQYIHDDSWRFNITKEMIDLDGVNHRATDKSIDASPNSWNTPLEAIMDIAFKTIKDIATRESIDGLGSALSRNFEYLENGGFITERYIEIEDYSDEQFEQILSQGTVPDPEFARDKIKNRPFYLKDIVNIDLWNSYIQGLVSDNDKLDLFDDVSGIQQFNLSKYFRNWKFGERLTLVYPTGGLGHQFTSFIRDGLSSEISDDIQRDKSYHFREIVGADATLMAVRAAGLLTEDAQSLIEDQEVIDIYSAPLVSKSRRIDPRKLKDISAATRVSDILDDAEQITTSLFTLDMTDELKSLAGQFNNLVLPTRQGAGRQWIGEDENFGNGNIEVGNLGLDNRYPYSDITFARNTYLQDENSNFYLDSLGDKISNVTHGPSMPEDTPPEEVVDMINSLGFVEPEFTSLEDVRAKIKEISIRLFGWNIFDSYDLRTSLSPQQYSENPTRTALDLMYSPALQYEMPQIYDPKGFIQGQRPSLAHWFVRLNYPNSGQRIDEIPTHLTSNQLDSGESRYNFSSHWRYFLESAYESDIFEQSNYDQTTEQGEGSSTEVGTTMAFGHRRNSMIDVATSQKWTSAADPTYGRGGLFLIYAEVSDIKTKLREFRSEFGNRSTLASLTQEQKNKLRNVFQRIEAHLQTQIEKPFEVGKNSINKCFFDGNPENISPANRPFESQCQEYEYLNRSTRQIDFYIRNLDNPEAVPPIRDLSLYYESDFRSVLRDDIVNTEEYAVMFNYIFPMPRLHSLLAMYCIEHTSKLPGREAMFDQTKQMIEEIFKSTLKSKDQDWWRKNGTPERPPSWLDSSLSEYIPPWLIIILTPFKILQALLILVPPLKWLLSLPGGLDDFLKNMLPPYRKDKNSDEDPCR